MNAQKLMHWYFIIGGMVYGGSFLVAGFAANDPTDGLVFFAISFLAIAVAWMADEHRARANAEARAYENLRRLISQADAKEYESR